MLGTLVACTLEDMWGSLMGLGEVEVTKMGDEVEEAKMAGFSNISRDDDKTEEVGKFRLGAGSKLVWKAPEVDKPASGI